MDDLSDLLDAERDIDAPTAEVQARVLARLEAALPLGAAPTAPPGGGGATSGAVGKVLYSALLLAIGAVGGAGAHAALTPRTSANEASKGASAAPILSSAPAPQALSAPPTASPAPSGVTPIVAPSASGPADERARGKAQLKTERLLLESAQTALRGGDTESALGALRRHAREFPHGQLVEERELMMVQVLNASGDDAAARRSAAEFKKKFPGSLMQGAVDQASKEPTKP